MQHGKSTKITIYEDKATGISSASHGSNVTAMVFNMDLIAPIKPILAVQIMQLYDELHSIEKDDPKAPDEDQKLALEKLEKLMQKVYDK